MDRMEFTQGVTRTRVLEKKLLDQPTIDKMVDAKDLEEVLRALGDTEYASAVSAVEKGEDYEQILANELKKSYDLMREISPQDEVVDLMALKYDYHNLKVMLKEHVMEKDLSDLYIPIGTIDFNKLKAMFKAEQMRDIQLEFKEAIAEIIKDYEEQKDPQRIDILADRHYFKHLYKIAKGTEIDLFKAYVKDLIDFLNVSAAIRLKKQGKDLRFFREVILFNGNIERDDILLTMNDSIDVMMNKFRNARISKQLLKGLEAYQETGRLSIFEKYMDNYMISLNKDSKSVTFGPEPLFSYLVAKEMEMKILRIIMVSKMNNLSPEAIRERLRDLYV
ncbi:V-type ATP synthase subunit C [Gudongella sp. DL1XJH-153]|uniref:V-type ATP synthase subunit C n=1 Tax=Gudongella sp. DL1XJH-153 TaxID=3409804 RepID=UPI003BB59FE0